MVDFNKVMENVWLVEHGNLPEKVLHHNKKEDTYTFYGIYPYTKLKSHKIITDIIEVTQSTKEASVLLASMDDLYQEVLDFYRKNFFNKLGLQYLTSTRKASELMVFFVNVGTSKYRVGLAVKYVQSIIGAKVDGIVGVETLTKINNFPDDKFDKLFDEFEVKFYKGLVARNRRLGWALKGWINRAFIV